MEWTKILNKGWVNVLQAIIMVVMFIIVMVTFIGTGDNSTDDESVRSSIESLREQLVTIEEYYTESINTINGVIERNDKIIAEFKEYRIEAERSDNIVTELARDNIEHTIGIREVQDRLIESELVTDEIKQLIRRIEQDNNYN